MKKDQIDKIDSARRGMLKKLGLAAVAAYVAPAMLNISSAQEENGSSSSITSSSSDSD